MFKKQLIHTFYKEPKQWRISTNTAYYDKLSELTQKYPTGELVGNLHDDKQEFIAVVKVDVVEEVVETVETVDTIKAKTVVTYATLQVNSRKYAVIQSVLSQGGIPEFTIHSYHKSNALALDEIKRLMKT